MITLTVEEAGAALGLPPLASPVTGVSIDSRTLERGDLFVALRGNRFNGHDYVRAAFAAGASGAVVERKAWTKTCRTQLQNEKKPIYVVEDTLTALGALARLVRRKSGATVLAVTGSVGKTSTKDLLFALASQVRRVVTTRENQNNEVGVPLTLFSIEPETEIVVVEMGMRGSGQIAELARIAEPDVGIITNIHPVHLELLGSIEAIAKAKVELLQNLRPGGIGVVPGECKPLMSVIPGCSCRLIRFAPGSSCAEAEIRGSLVQHEGSLSCNLIVEWPTGRTELEVSLAPPGFLENVLAAAAGCYAAGLPLAACLRGVETGTGSDTGSGRRWRILQLPGLVVIDDSYNANPVAVRAALDELVRVASTKAGRPVAVLGDMLELGGEETRYHKEVGAYAAEKGVGLLWGVGRLASLIVEGYVEALQKLEGSPAMAGARHGEAGHTGAAEEISPILDSLHPGDVVLIKASRGMQLDRVADRVVAEAEAGRWSTGVRRTSRPAGAGVQVDASGRTAGRMHQC